MNNSYDNEYLKDYGIEFYIISCVVIWPDLMPQVIIDNKYFRKYPKLWHFMKAFYEKYKTFDTRLMRYTCTDRYKMSSYIEMIAEAGPIHKPSEYEFELYQKQLIDEYDKNEKEKWIINKIFEATNKLYVRGITLEDYKKQVEQIELDANKIFKEV